MAARAVEARSMPVRLTIKRWAEIHIEGVEAARADYDAGV